MVELLDIKKRNIEAKNIEKKVDSKRAGPNDKRRGQRGIEDENGSFVSNMIIDFVVFMDNLDNAYALGYDMVDYLCS